MNDELSSVDCGPVDLGLSIVNCGPLVIKCGRWARG